ncbi:hypothetical protein QBC42DRAFT_288493 [Cladorrhinum samala]|uniref:F-box domain-containing protein n=1 Tax=Cladorrhinum samala TaxID=585594 RepID=A0AAV9HIC5_9PEZI|nr:hypothetical protein QBC42DRAFT_288493 [Cladorrhinum samala]
MSHTTRGARLPVRTKPGTQRTQLLDLPNEILLAIAESFYSVYRHGSRCDLSLDPADANHTLNLSEYHRDRLALARLCGASRRLRDVCSPVLYEEFVPVPADGFSIARLPYLNTMRPARVDRRLPRFLNTILTRRDLAGRVRRAHITADLLFDTPEVEGSPSLHTYTYTSTAVAALAAARLRFPLGEFLSALGIDDLAAPCTMSARDDRQRRCSHATARVLVAILIGALPNLEHLSVQSGWIIKTQIPARALAIVSGKRRGQLPLRVLDVSNFWAGSVYSHVQPHWWTRFTSTVTAVAHGTSRGSGTVDESDGRDSVLQGGNSNEENPLSLTSWASSNTGVWLCEGEGNVKGEPTLGSRIRI